jgi:hypothetical protein
METVMSIKGRRVSLAMGILGAALAVATPVFAQHGGGGGGHGGGGGGGHGGGGGGGGGHASAGHFGGGIHASAGHFGGGVAHYGGGAHYGAASSGHFAAGAGHVYAGGGRAAYGYPGGAYGHGYSTGATWRGGYWRGGYWPRAYYGYGFSWFLPILPLAYATYWYGGIPYYYANDVYYTWNPDYNGYTASDPPPVTEGSLAGADGSAAPAPVAGMAPGAGDMGAGAGAQIFMYPKNGQSEEQQSIDRRECQQWAASQAGAGAANGSDYRRAMMACVAGRGYSAN